MRWTAAAHVALLFWTSCTFVTSFDGLTSPAGPRDGGTVAIGEGRDAAVTDSGPDVRDCRAAGLVAGWSFDEGGGTVVRDCSINAIHGAFAGASASLRFGTRAGGGCLEVDGAGGRITMGKSNALQLTEVFTVAAWVRRDVDTNGFVNVAGNLAAGGWEIVLDSMGSLHTQVVFTDASSRVVKFPMLQAGVWRHLTAVFERGVRLETYVDGVLASSLTSAEGLPTVGLAPSKAEFTIGLSTDAATWVGAIDEVRVYSRALTNAEIIGLAKK